MRLLVVEDNEKLAAAMRTGLQQEGYAVDVAPDGEAARATLRARPPCVSSTVISPASASTRSTAT